MSAGNIGWATLSVVPSMRGMDAVMRREMGLTRSVVAQGGENASRDFGSRFLSGMQSVGDGARELLSSSLESGAVAGAALVGAALTSGFRRFTMIEDATASLTIQLGDAVEAKSLLDDVMDVVIGTPFDFNDFAMGAQQLTAFGAEAREIPQWLTAIGEASATQGSRAPQFAQSLIDVFGRMTARTRVQLRDIWSIAQTGVPALTILANAFEVTNDQMAAMISDPGTIVDSTKAIDAITEGIIHGSDGVAGATKAFDGTMEALRQTLTGVLGGFKSALARTGVGMIEPFREVLWQGFQTGIEVLDDFTERLEGFGERLGSSRAMGQVTDWLEDVPSKVGPAMESMRNLGPALGAAGGGLVSFASGALRSIPLLGMLVPSITPIIGVIGGFIAMSPELRAAAGEIVSAFGEVLGDGLAALAPAIPAVSDALVVLGVGLADVLVAAIPLVGPLAEIAAVVVDAGLVPALGLLAGGLSLFAGGLSGVLGPIADLVGWLVEIPGVAEVAGFAIAGIVAVQMVHRFAAFADLIRVGIGVGFLEARGGARGFMRSLRTIDGWRKVGGAALVAGILLVADAWRNVKREADTAWADWEERLAWQFDDTSLAGLEGRISLTKREIAGMYDEYSRWDSVQGDVLGGLQLFASVLPGVDATIGNHRGEVVRLGEGLEEYEEKWGQVMIALTDAAWQQWGSNPPVELLEELAGVLAANGIEMTGIAEVDAPRALNAFADLGLEGDSLAEALKGVSSSGEPIVDVLARVADTVDDLLYPWQERLGDALNGASNHFAEFTEEAQSSIRLLEEEMLAQLEAQSRWHDNLTLLAERGGVDLALQWAEMGPEYAGALDGLVQMSDEEFYRMAYISAVRAAEQSRMLGEEWKENPIIMQRELDNMLQALRDHDWETDTEGVGVGLMKGIIKGMRVANPLLDLALSTLADRIPDRVAQFMGIESPSRVMADRIGRPITQGIAVGMLAERGMLERAERELVSMLTGRSGRLAATMDPELGVGASAVYPADRTVVQDNSRRNIIEGYNRDPAAILNEMRLRDLQELSAEH